MLKSRGQNVSLYVKLRHKFMGTIEITVWGCSRRLETPSKSFPTLDVIIGGHLSIVALLVWGGIGGNWGRGGSVWE